MNSIWTDIYFEIQKFKNERSWYNLNLSKDALKDILEEESWYTLFIPSSELEFNHYHQVRLWQELAISLLKTFIEKLYNQAKSRYLSDKHITEILNKNHPNFEKEYNFLIKKTEEILLSKIKALKEKVATREFKETIRIDNDFEALYSNMHLYQPLIYIDKGRYEEVIKVQPVALNKGERDLVEHLRMFYQSDSTFFLDKQLYLLRNMSKKGIGFFEANNFFPDFILWLVTPEKQYVAFIDPKGLRQIQGFEDPKIKFFKTIKMEIESKLNDPSIELNSFIVSPTPANQLSHWKGQNSIEDFNAYNVYFQKEQGDYYIKAILSKLTFKPIII